MTLFIKWNSTNIRHHLGAISYEFDAVFKNKGLDPEKLRTQFYNVFHKKSVIFDIHFYMDSIVFKIGICGGSESDNWGETGEEWEDYLVVWKDIDIYYSCIARCSKRISTFFDDDEEEEWELHEPHEANFVKITIEYGRVIRDICERWGYSEIIKNIKEYQSS